MDNRVEKKVEVITKEGRKVRVMPHMLEDMARFEATQVKKIVKETPKELIKVPLMPVEKVDVLPEMVNTKTEINLAEKINGTIIVDMSPVKKPPVKKAVKKAKK